ncbi:MAG: hypothetical protein U1E65_00015 [Myxococcota bacterium]
MHARLYAAAAAAAALCTACPTNDCFIGDPNAAPTIGVVYRSGDGTMHDLAAGGQVPLLLPPQGGKVIFVGVRAKNIDGCPVTISASIRDQCTQSLIAHEERPVTLESTGDGWLTPKIPDALENYSNLPACPRAALDRDVNNEPYQLEIKIEDKKGRTATTAITVVPVCNTPDQQAQCECECAADYRQGASCTGEHPDSGVPAGTCRSDGGSVGGDQ